MNKLELGNNGGMPFVQDDLEFLQKSLSDALIALGEGFATVHSFIWLKKPTGVLVGSNYVFPEGYIIHQGEVYKVIESTIPQSAFPFIDISENYDSNGSKTFENFSPVNTYKVREARITNINNNNSSTLNYFNGIFFHDAIAIKATEGDTYMKPYIRTCMLPNAWQTAMVYTSPWTGNLRYRSLQTGEVALQGQISISNYNGHTTAVTLPLGFRPLVNAYFVMLDTDGLYRNVYIEPNGRIRVFGAINVPVILHLDLIRFFTN